MVFGFQMFIFMDENFTETNILGFSTKPKTKAVDFTDSFGDGNMDIKLAD